MTINRPKGLQWSKEIGNHIASIGAPGATVLVDGERCEIMHRDWRHEDSLEVITRNGVELPPTVTRRYRIEFDIRMPKGNAARLAVAPDFDCEQARLNPVAVLTIPPVHVAAGVVGCGSVRLTAWVQFAERRQAALCFVEIVDAPVSNAVLAPGWKRNKLALKSIPNGRTPAVFTFGNKCYTVPSGKAWDTVVALIEADALDGHPHPMPTPSGHFKREHRAFFTERMRNAGNGAGWYIATT